MQILNVTRIYCEKREISMHFIKVLFISFFASFIPLGIGGCATNNNINNREGKKIEKFKPALSFYYDNVNFINYEKHGNGKVPLILLHGFGSSLRNWDDVVANLAQTKAFDENFTLYALDLKGAGFSSKPRDGRYAIKDNAEIVTAFLKKLNLKHPVIVGHSLGGGVALYTTVHLQENSLFYPSHLVLVDAASYPTEYPFFVKFLRVPLFNKLLINGLPDDYRARRTMELIVADKTMITPEIIHRYAYAYKLKNYDYALIETAKQISPDNIDHLIKGYKNITCPTTILWGRKDSVLPLTLGEHLQKDIKNSTLIIKDQFAHNLPEESPLTVANAIRNSIKK